ncbi:hypothetical protein MDA_GLEAN10017479 [Myotis davidii]|uniref:Uncharacterized protein n=1 Tax=Myotis davidii TaxID=225400 RepID=L5LBQ4_MYODS|nr:hypothetical protein MDA_GLEAN10017479 [Myotis davidii]
MLPATKVHALDQNRTWDPGVRRPTLYPLSQTAYGFDILAEPMLSEVATQEPQTGMPKQHMISVAKDEFCSLPLPLYPEAQQHPPVEITKVDD